MGPDNCIFAPMDVTSESDVTSALKATKEKFGRLDATINCAGIGVAIRSYNPNKDRVHNISSSFLIDKVTVIICWSNVGF